MENQAKVKTVQKCYEYLFMGKKHYITNDNAVAYIVSMVLFIIVFTYLNISATAHMIAYATSIPVWMAVVFSFCLGTVADQAIKKYKEVKMLKAINTGVWRVLSITGVYWAVYHSDWSVYTIGLLIACLLVSVVIKVPSTKKVFLFTFEDGTTVVERGNESSEDEPVVSK
jgi:hypothetical protein